MEFYSLVSKQSMLAGREQSIGKMFASFCVPLPWHTILLILCLTESAIVLAFSSGFFVVEYS